MKFVISRASNDDVHEIKNFTSLADLIEFQEKQQHSIILRKNFWFQENPQDIKEWYPHIDADTIVTIPYELEIYDDYIE